MEDGERRINLENGEWRINLENGECRIENGHLIYPQGFWSYLKQPHRQVRFEHLFC